MKRYIIILFMFFSCNQGNEKQNADTKTERAKLDSLKIPNIISKSPLQLHDTTVIIVWRGERYDTIVKDSVSSIMINENYCKSAIEPVKAAIAFVGTFIGSDCQWDGDANSNFTNLNCKLISALGLGYQCSEKHINFLKQWLSKEPVLFKSLKIAL